MIKVFISCAGGFSSGALVNKLKRDIIAQNMQDKIEVEFSPFMLAANTFEGKDIIMVCPHQRYQIEEYNEKYIKNRIPVYVLPTRIYGTMHLHTIYEDALDLIELFKESPQNPVHFPGEENPLKVFRTEPHRRVKK